MILDNLGPLIGVGERLEPSQRVTGQRVVFTKTAKALVPEEELTDSQGSLRKER